MRTNAYVNPTWGRTYGAQVATGVWDVVDKGVHVGADPIFYVWDRPNSGPWSVSRDCLLMVGDEFDVDLTRDPKVAEAANLRAVLDARGNSKTKNIRAKVSSLTEQGVITHRFGVFVPYSLVVPVKTTPAPRTWVTTATYDGSRNPEAAKNANLPDKRYSIDVKEDHGDFIQSTERRYPVACLTDVKSVSSDGKVSTRGVEGHWVGGHPLALYTTLDAAQKSFDR